MPLSKNGLWDAEIITPISARKDRVNMATAGVGIGPTIITSMPMEIKPDVRAGSIIYPERRVSLPITTRCLCSPRVKYLPAAMPTRIAISAVMFPSLAFPRMPSVPKYFRAIVYKLFLFLTYQQHVFNIYMLTHAEYYS